MSTKLPKEIQRVIEKTAELQAEIQSVGQSSIREMFQTFFAAYPDVEAVEWTQYTPHFNDGEPCTFTIYEPSVRLREGVLVRKGDPASKWGKEYQEDLLSDGEEFYDLYTLDSDEGEVHEQMVAALHEIEGIFHQIDTTMQAVFGDGVKVTVTSEEVEIEEYDHD